MKTWIRKDTASTDEEAARMNPMLPPRVLDGVRQDTASSDEEIAALQRRLSAIHAVRPSPWRGLLPVGVGAVALVGSVALAAVWVAPPTSDTPPPVLADTGHVAAAYVELEPGVEHRLGPSITVQGLGKVQVDRQDGQGAALSVVDGAARFVVDPDGQARRLVVTAGDVQIEVLGTIFSVQHTAGSVAVVVDRGKVRVTWRDVSTVVVAGERWERGAGVVSASGLPASPVASQDVAVPQPPRAIPSASPGRVVESAIPTDAQAEVADPCEDDPFSIECRRTRVQPAASSAETLYQSLRAALPRAGQDWEGDRLRVENCNRFLELYPTHPYATDVRAMRVRFAFHGERASEVHKYTESFLATAAVDHPERPEVEKMAKVASLRLRAMDGAHTGQCEGAMPSLRDLVGVETGRHRSIALAYLTLCARSLGRDEEARDALRGVRTHDLPPDLRERLLKEPGR